MSEYEILDLANQAESQITAILQWWGGVSFGVLAVAHFTAKKLNAAVVVLAALLYASFSVLSYTRVSDNLQEYAGYFVDLVSLQEAGISLAPSTVQRLESAASYPWYSDLAFRTALFGTFLGTVCYLVYANLRGRKNRA